MCRLRVVISLCWCVCVYRTQCVPTPERPPRPFDEGAFSSARLRPQLGQDGAITMEEEEPMYMNNPGPTPTEPMRASTERGALAVGTRVALQGLARRPDLNGRTGTIVQELNGRGRLGVLLDTKSEAAPIACKPENVCSPRNGGEVAVKVLFDADVFCHLAELLRGWSSDAFADVARMRRVCSSWNRALQKVSRRVDLGKGIPFQLDAKRLLLIEDRIATVVRQAPHSASARACLPQPSTSTVPHE